MRVDQPLKLPCQAVAGFGFAPTVMPEKRNLEPVNSSSLVMMALGLLLFLHGLVLLNLVEWPVAEEVPESNIRLDFVGRQERLKLRESARQMFYFGYDSYMNYAFPEDELDPIHCTGRGADKANPYVIIRAADDC